MPESLSPQLEKTLRTTLLRCGKYNIHIHGGQIGSIDDGTHVDGGINFGGKKDS